MANCRTDHSGSWGPRHPRPMYAAGASPKSRAPFLYRWTWDRICPTAFFWGAAMHHTPAPRICVRPKGNRGKSLAGKFWPTYLHLFWAETALAEQKPLHQFVAWRVVIHHALHIVPVQQESTHNKYPLYKVYMGLIIKGRFPRAPPFALWNQGELAIAPSRSLISYLSTLAKDATPPVLWKDSTRKHDMGNNGEQQKRTGKIPSGHPVN